MNPANARLSDAPVPPVVWGADEGECLTGIVTDIIRRWLEPDGDVYPILTVETRDRDAFVFGAHHGAARRQIEDLQVGVGDEVSGSCDGFDRDSGLMRYSVQRVAPQRPQDDVAADRGRREPTS